MERKSVFHKVFGQGLLISLRKSPAGVETECLVQFDSGLKLWIPATRLQGLEEELKEGIVQNGKLIKDEELKAKAHRMIEAMRLGIVPTQDTCDFTFGREKEIRVLTHALDTLLYEGQGGALLIEAPYGGGKTHFLEYIKAEALKKNFLVSLVELSTEETTPSRPKRVYRELITNLRYYKKTENKLEGCFRDFLRSAAQYYRPPNFLGMKDHIFFAPVLKQLLRIDNESLKAEVFWQLIEAESTKEYALGSYRKDQKFKMPFRISGAWRIPALYDFSTAIDFYCYLISGLSYLARQMNFGGLVFLIDEAETVSFSTRSLYYERGFNFLQGLIKTAQNSPPLKNFNEDLIHNQVRPTPYIYKESYLLLVLASTPDPISMRLKEFVDQSLELEPLKYEHLNSCFKTLVGYYKIAYPQLELSDAQKQELFKRLLKYHKEGLRIFIKSVIECLDAIRLKRSLAI
jgi:hypothetical protein